MRCILQFMDKVAWISWGKQGNASKYFFATGEILRNCSPLLKISECKIREGHIIAGSGWTEKRCDCTFVCIIK